MTERRKEELRRKISLSRARVIRERPFFGLLLMYFKYVAVKSIKKISTDGRNIYFNPMFFEKLNNDETDYVLCHQLMHILSGDIWREEDLANDDWHFACDIHINNEMTSSGFSCDNIYRLGDVVCRVPGADIVTDGLTKAEIYRLIPFSLYVMEEAARSRFIIDSDAFWGGSGDIPEDGELVLDILSSDGLIERDKKASSAILFGGSARGEEASDAGGGAITPEEKRKNSLIREWQGRVVSVMNTVKSSDKKAGESLPPTARSFFKKLKPPTVNWRKILNDFLQEEINDYSFSPPDRRFTDFDFFLPDYNESEFVTKNILFMVDTSGSMNEKQIVEAYSEIKGAIEQFNGRLQGYLGFFDTEVTPPVPFKSVQSLNAIIPYGGGGTDFYCIFDYLKSRGAREEPPSCLIILTDGMADFPPEPIESCPPVLWLINNNEIAPPWGRVARIIKKRGGRAD